MISETCQKHAARELQIDSKKLQMIKITRAGLCLNCQNDRLGDLVLETVVCEAQAVFEILQNTNTLLLDAYQSRRPRWNESPPTRREDHCQIKPIG